MYNVDPAVRFFATPPVDGCLCETVNHPAAFAYHLPDTVSFGEGALLEPTAVGNVGRHQGAHQARRCVRGHRLRARWGCSQPASAALAGGASKVLVSDVSTIKLAIVGQGAGRYPRRSDRRRILVERVREETAGWGADVAFECSGAPQVLLMRRSGSSSPRAVARPSSSVFRSTRSPIDVTELQATEVRIENVFRYANVYQKAIDLVASGRAGPQALHH